MSKKDQEMSMQIEKSQIFRAAFNKGENTDELVAKMSQKLQCSCEKDPLYKFSCQQGVKWFLNASLVAKIRRKLNERETPDGETPGGGEQDAFTVISQTILDEYTKCKQHYKSILTLEPKPESAQ